MIVSSNQNLNLEGIRYDRISISVNLATSPTGKMIANVILTPMKLDEDGRVLLAPPDKAKTFRSSDLDAQAEGDPVLAAMLVATRDLIQALANSLEA